MVQSLIEISSDFAGIMKKAMFCGVWFGSLIYLFIEMHSTLNMLTENSMFLDAVKYTLLLTSFCLYLVFPLLVAKCKV